MQGSEYITIDEALKKASGKVNLRGWIYRHRSSNKFVFINLRDESNIIQCVISKSNVPDLFDEATKLTIESSVKISGVLKEDERAPTGYEVSVTDLKIVQISEAFPITEHQSPELLYDNRHLWIRSRKLNAVFKIRHTIVGAIHEFFRSHGYYEFDAPIFQPSMSE
ncbi:MAG: asparagine--tRNA ligase, partial [Candidatus Lokiarchaeota archaeon]|nr:asparagine--tRNA ligase [Candidatus Lokiarchaeota archaeon]